MMTMYNYIKTNPALITFINKIMTYNAIFDNEQYRYMFLTSLISADTLISIETCDDTINTANFILSNINFFVLDKQVKEEIIKYISKAIEISNKEKQLLKNKK